MADNVTLNSGSGGATCASDDIGGVQHQRVKVQYGEDGSATDVSDTNPAPTKLTATTTGGLSIFRSLDLDESEEEVKGSAGTIYWINVNNIATTIRYLKIYDGTAASVVVGTTTPVLTIALPSRGTANGFPQTMSIPHGLAFANGITVAATTGVLDNSVGAPATNAIIVNIGYK